MFKTRFNLFLQAAQSAVYSLPGQGPRVHEVITEYLASSRFRKLAPLSQKPYRRVLMRWLEDEGVGPRPIRSISRDELEAALAKLPQGSANFLYKRLRVLFGCALERKYIKVDPTQGIKCEPIGNEHHTWTDDEIAQYRDHWPLGSRERLAFELALNTSQRRGDLAGMDWKHVRNGRIAVTQQKTDKALSVPIHPDLKAELDRVKGPRTGAIIAKKGTQAHLTAASLGNLMAEWIEAAGLDPRCVLHGLRKACARRLAEAGATVKEIQAIGGWDTLKEVERYTKAADQVRLSDAAMARIKPR